MLIVFVPILLPSLITNLKYLAPFSAIANLCMATGVGVVFYYAFQDIPNLSDRKYVGDLDTIPLFFGTAMFAFEGIALVRFLFLSITLRSNILIFHCGTQQVLPLKNSMRKPLTFAQPIGVLNIGISFVTILYILFGFFGYLKWGEDVQGSLTLNLPEADM